MNKLLHMNSFFTRIILAVLSFAAIICAFVPYFQIPAVEAVHDVDTNEQTLKINIGKDAETVNIISEFSNGQPFLIYSDEALTQTVEPTALPTPGTPGTETTYWIQFFAYGYTYNAETGKKVLDFIPLSVYTLLLNKGTEAEMLTSVNVNKVEKKITINVPNTEAFNFSRVIDTKNVWAIYDNRLTGFAESIKEARSLPVKRGETLQYYTAITLKSETNPMSASAEEGKSSIVYYPLDMYTLIIYRDDIRSTLPTVGEFGMGVLSAKATNDAGGTMTLYSGDAWMFLLMILALVSTLFSFVIPNKLRIIQTITGSLLGLLLIVMPILDSMFFMQNNFIVEPGMYILIALGVLIIFFAVFDFIRCHAEYTAELVHLYGEDYKEQRKAEKAEARLKAARDKEIAKTDDTKTLKKKEKKEKKEKKAKN